MYVCMYIYIYVYIQVICTCIHIYLYTNTDICIYAIYIYTISVLAPGSEINVFERRPEGVRQKGVFATNAGLLILCLPYRGFSSG